MRWYFIKDKQLRFMDNTCDKIKILIADDHKVVREGLHAILNKIQGLDVIGEAKNGADLIDKVTKLHPDVVLTDVKMPIMNGIEATKTIKQNFPTINVIAFTFLEEEYAVRDMLSAGASGFLLKTASVQEIVRAIERVYKNENYYCLETKNKLAEAYCKQSCSSKPKEIEEKFTKRERQVIQIICEGYSSKQIAARLQLKTRTVERYRDEIMIKMDVKNVAGLVMFAVRHKIETINT